MPTSQNRQHEINKAVLAATRELQRLGINQSTRVDIFNIVESSGIWLMFEQFKTIFGCYQRFGEVAGIQVNANHPLSLQRFTAAHEYGHHVLGHTASVDEADHIQPGKAGISEQELAAQTFAAHFLMPLPIVNTTLQLLGLSITPKTMSYSEAYRFSLQLGVSYSAAVTHLGNIRKLTPNAVKELRRVQPKSIKTAIGQSGQLADSRADVWEIDERDQGRILYPRVHDELHISIPENPSTGYIWELRELNTVDFRTTNSPEEIRSEQAALGVLKDAVEIGMDGNSYVGGGGRRRLVYRLLRPGRLAIHLEKRRPWLRNTVPEDTFEVLMEVSARPTGEADRGLSFRQQRLIAA